MLRGGLWIWFSPSQVESKGGCRMSTLEKLAKEIEALEEEVIGGESRSEVAWEKVREEREVRSAKARKELLAFAKKHSLRVSNRGRYGRKTTVLKFYDSDGEKRIVIYPGKGPEARVDRETGRAWIPVTVGEAKKILAGKAEVRVVVK